MNIKAKNLKTCWLDIVRGKAVELLMKIFIPIDEIPALNEITIKSSIELFYKYKIDTFLAFLGYSMTTNNLFQKFVVLCGDSCSCDVLIELITKTFGRNAEILNLRSKYIIEYAPLIIFDDLELDEGAIDGLCHLTNSDYLPIEPMGGPRKIVKNNFNIIATCKNIDDCDSSRESFLRKVIFLKCPNKFDSDYEFPTSPYEFAVFKSHLRMLSIIYSNQILENNGFGDRYTPEKIRNFLEKEKEAGENNEKRK
jgi:hypothetical protein